MEELFIQNKYYCWYLKICEKDDCDEYTEKHHRIPKSMGGGNGINIVKLSFRKHFLAHWLLTKCTSGKNKERMLNAMNRMTSIVPSRKRKNGTMSKESKRIVTSWQFAVARRAAREAMIGKIYTPERNAKIGLYHKGRPKPPGTGDKIRKAKLASNYKDSLETREKKAKAWRGRKHTEETKQKMSIKGKRPKTPEHVEAIRVAAKLRPSRKGTTLSEETKSKMKHARWITNGVETRRLLHTETEPPEGWYYGRPTMKGNKQSKLGGLASRQRAIANKAKKQS